MKFNNLYEKYLDESKEQTIAGEIKSGWYHKEDAGDALDEERESFPQNKYKVFSKKFLVSKGLSPEENENWQGGGKSKSKMDQEGYVYYVVQLDN